MEEKQKRLVREEEEKQEVKERARIEKECEEQVAKIALPVPVNIVERVLTGAEKTEILEACVRELEESEPGRMMMRVVQQFADFFLLLGRPENQIKVRTGQYVEREINTRIEADMVNEVVRELISLAKYTAYAKILHEMDGQQRVWIGKIQTIKRSQIQTGELAEAIREAGLNGIRSNSNCYMKRRDEIGREIRTRHARWRQIFREERSPISKEAEERRLPTFRDSDIDSDEPPPTHG